MRYIDFRSLKKREKKGEEWIEERRTSRMNKKYAHATPKYICRERMKVVYTHIKKRDGEKSEKESPS